MKIPALLTEETLWHENGRIVTRAAGTKCQRVVGPLKDVESDAGVAASVEQLVKSQGRVPILLDGRLRHVAQHKVQDDKSH